MTATEQHATGLFLHQNGRQSPTAASCISANVGSITDFLFSTAHSTVSTSINIPPSENNDEIRSTTVSSPTVISSISLPEIVVHHSSEMTLDPLSGSVNSNGTMNLTADNDPTAGGSKEKLGHRRVDQTGNVTYKRVMVDDLMKSLQIGLNYVLGKHHQPQRQVLLQDFQQVEYQDFPPDGSKSTPVHQYPEFRLKTYAKIAFRFFRNTFGVDPSSFMLSLCARDLRELPNPGASGSIFYITSDDAYIIKTVSKKEARFLLSLLPAYYMNLTQNPFTLLPKFFGLYCYQSANKNIRFVIMNNLIPTNVKLHEKYDLKGSIYKRKASEEERKRDLPTFKDNDFKSLHPHGLRLEPFFFDQLMQTIEDDVRVLGSFDIMDYSLLLGVHNITEELKSTDNLHLLPSAILSHSSSPSQCKSSLSDSITTSSCTTQKNSGLVVSADSGITMSRDISNIPTYTQYIRVIDFIRAQKAPSVHSSSISNPEHSLLDHSHENNDTASMKTVKPDLVAENQSNTHRLYEHQMSLPSNSKSPIHSTETSSPFDLTTALIGGNAWYNRQNLSRLAMAGIPAVNEKGDLLLLYVGIIDILQNYRLRKKLEHAFKSTLVTREEVSVCNPSHYGDRFSKFLSRKVFRKEGHHDKSCLSDSRSNTDQITLHSSRLMHPSSCQSQMSGDDDDDDDDSSISKVHHDPIVHRS